MRHSPLPPIWRYSNLALFPAVGMFLGSSLATACDISYYIRINGVEIDCNDTITLCKDPGTCASKPEFIPNVLFDSCDEIVNPIGWLRSDGAPGLYDPFPVGQTTVTFNASADGQTATCSFVVNVLDCDAELVCPANLTTSQDPDQCGAVVNYPAPTGSCTSVTCSPPSGSFFPIGTTTVTCSSPSAGTCTFTVTVLDTQPPRLTCPDDILVPATSAAGETVNYSFHASDNCPGVVSSSVPPSGSLFPIGDHTVVCHAVDASGNAAQCTFVVKVQPTDVRISKAANLTTVRVGQLLTYSLTVENLGPGTADGVVVNDPVPLGSTFVSATSAQGTISAPPVGAAGVVSYNIGKIPSGGSVKLSLVVKVTGRGRTTLTNTAQVNSTTYDPNLANNAASVQTRIFGSGK